MGMLTKFNVLRNLILMGHSLGMQSQHPQDSNTFRYIIRGMPEQTGSIPRSIFEADPHSMLNMMYNGDQEYATDHFGRANVNSDPAHWNMILNWLTFGSIPAQPTDEFLAECSYWRLAALLAKMEEQRIASCEDVVTFKTPEHTIRLTYIEARNKSNYPTHRGFQLEGMVHNFRVQYPSSASKTVQMDFKVSGSLWRLKIGQAGVYLQLIDGPPWNDASLSLSFGKHQERNLGRGKLAYMSDTAGWGHHWPDGDIAEEVQQFPCLGLNGSLLVTLKLLVPYEYSSPWLIPYA